MLSLEIVKGFELAIIQALEDGIERIETQAVVTPPTLVPRHVALRPHPPSQPREQKASV